MYRVFKHIASFGILLVFLFMAVSSYDEDIRKDEKNCDDTEAVKHLVPVINVTVLDKVTRAPIPNLRVFIRFRFFKFDDESCERSQKVYDANYYITGENGKIQVTLSSVTSDHKRDKFRVDAQVSDGSGIYWSSPAAQVSYYSNFEVFELTLLAVDQTLL